MSPTPNDQDLRDAFQGSPLSRDEQIAVSRVISFARAREFTRPRPRQMPLLRALSFAAVAIVLLTVAGLNLKLISDRHLARTPATTPSPVTYRIATSPQSDLGFQARLDGVLGGIANNDGTACLWIGGAYVLLPAWSVIRGLGRRRRHNLEDVGQELPEVCGDVISTGHVVDS